MAEQYLRSTSMVEVEKDKPLYPDQIQDSLECKKRKILALYLREGANAGGFERLSDLYSVTKETMFKWIAEYVKEPGMEQERDAFIKRVKQDIEETQQKETAMSKLAINEYKDVYETADKMLSAGHTLDEIGAILHLTVPALKKHIRIYIYIALKPEDRQNLSDGIKEAIKGDVYFTVETSKKNGSSR